MEFHKKETSKHLANYLKTAFLSVAKLYFIYVLTTLGKQTSADIRQPRAR